MEELLGDPRRLTDRDDGASGIPVQGRIALYCRSGVRSARAVTALRSEGIEAVSVSGGYLAYLSRAV